MLACLLACLLPQVAACNGSVATCTLTGPKSVIFRVFPSTSMAEVFTALDISQSESALSCPSSLGMLAKTISVFVATGNDYCTRLLPGAGVKTIERWFDAVSASSSGEPAMTPTRGRAAEPGFVRGWLTAALESPLLAARKSPVWIHNCIEDLNCAALHILTGACDGHDLGALSFSVDVHFVALQALFGPYVVNLLLQHFSLLTRCTFNCIACAVVFMRCAATSRTVYAI